MNVDLPYADGTVTATLPADTRRLSSEPAGALPPLADLEGAVRQALAAPLGLPRLRDLVKPGAHVTIEALREFCLAELGRYKSPKAFKFVAALPKGPSGKVQRLKLLEG